MSAEAMIGIDEAGMGCWAGPLFVAGVLWDESVHVPKLNDSKLLTAKVRDELRETIEAKAIGFHIQEVSIEKINEEGLAAARSWGILQIIQSCTPPPTRAVLDGVGRKHYGIPTEYVVKGDQKIPAISAASILAKTARDAVMQKLDAQFPGYGFAQHKGYGTKQHQAALKQYGACEIHRVWYQPVQKILRTTLFDLVPEKS